VRDEALAAGSRPGGDERANPRKGAAPHGRFDGL
jgi:hypothetical protein